MNFANRQAVRVFWVLSCILLTISVRADLTLEQFRKVLSEKREAISDADIQFSVSYEDVRVGVPENLLILRGRHSLQVRDGKIRVDFRRQEGEQRTAWNGTKLCDAVKSDGEAVNYISERFIASSFDGQTDLLTSLINVRYVFGNYDARDTEILADLSNPLVLFERGDYLEEMGDTSRQGESLRLEHEEFDGQDCYVLSLWRDTSTHRRPDTLPKGTVQVAPLAKHYFASDHGFRPVRIVLYSYFYGVPRYDTRISYKATGEPDSIATEATMLAVETQPADPTLVSQQKAFRQVIQFDRFAIDTGLSPSLFEAEEVFFPEGSLVDRTRGAMILSSADEISKEIVRNMQDDEFLKSISSQASSHSEVAGIATPAASIAPDNNLNSGTVSTAEGVSPDNSRRNFWILAGSALTLFAGGFFFRRVRSSAASSALPILLLIPIGVSAEKVELGVVPYARQYAKAQFTIRNTTDVSQGPLAIHVSCGCTTATVASNFLGPGQSVEGSFFFQPGTLTFPFPAEVSSGEISRTFSFESAKGSVTFGLPEQTGQITAGSLPGKHILTIEPKYLIARQDETSFSITAVSEDGVPLASLPVTLLPVQKGNGTK